MANLEETISFDTSATLAVEVNQQTSFDLILEVYEPDNITPHNISGTIHMAIGNTDCQSILLRLISPTDINIAGHIITVSRTAIDNTLPPGSYEYRLYESSNGGNTITPMAKGPFIVLPYAR